MTQNNQTTQSGNGDALSREVVVAGDHGLHARPAGKLAQQAQSFEAEILLVHEGQEVDAKSILDVLTLAAGPGDVVQIKASGSDAAQALDSLEALFQRRFEE